MWPEQTVKRFMTEVNDIFVSDQAIFVGHDGEGVVVEARTERYDGAVPSCASGRDADIYVR